MSLVGHLELIYQTAIRAVCPNKLVRDALKFVPAEVARVGKPAAGILDCDGNKFDIDANVKSK